MWDGSLGRCFRTAIVALPLSNARFEILDKRHAEGRVLIHEAWGVLGGRRSSRNFAILRDSTYTPSCTTLYVVVLPFPAETIKPVF